MYLKNKSGIVDKSPPLKDNTKNTKKIQLYQHKSIELTQRLIKILMGVLL